MRLIDADALKEVVFSKSDGMEDLWDTAGVCNLINNAPTIVVTTKLQFKERNNENGKLQRRKG